MGFKCISQTELRTKVGTNFLGVPLKFMEEIKQVAKFETKEKDQISKTADKISEITILNNETLEFHYDRNMKRKSADGYGNVSIINNSYKDRMWDTRIHILGSEYTNLDVQNELNLGIFEPQTNKNIKYNINNLDNLPDPLEINEKIEILNEEIKIVKDFTETYSSNQDDRYILLYGQESTVKFIITLHNVSNYIIKDIHSEKEIPKNFYDLDCSADSQIDIKIKNNKLTWILRELKPGEKNELVIVAKIFPEKKEGIRTGILNMTYELQGYTVSGTDIAEFTAYSHAKHVIDVEEKETEPNQWECSFIFANHSDFTMYLKNILITDKSKSTKYIDLDLSSEHNNIILRPGDTFGTNKWELHDENEPKFSRKIVYSLDYAVEKNTDVTLKMEDNVIEVIGFYFEKDISQKEIKSFEESELFSKIIIRNTGIVPIKGVIINETIPEDFKPSVALSQFKFKKSSGDIKLDDVVLNITPQDDDPSKEHALDLKINLQENRIQDIIAIDGYLEIIYPIKAITPDYNKAYEFPLEVSCYYARYENQEQNELHEYYVVKHTLSEMKKPTIKVTHKRRNLAIGKEIFPGRDADEFAISINVRNNSNVEIKDVLITDTIPNSFELVSSNTKNKISKLNKENEYIISFSIENVPAYQEKEIMYYLKNISGKEVNYSDLESYFFG
ncbi:MAG: hypothetical protein ACFFDK_00240 [Promethearchaeota archaeon]